MNPKQFTVLNPNTTRLDGAGGGVPFITANDINAACYGTDEIGLSLLLSKWANLRTPQSKPFYALYLEVIDMATRFKWKIRGEAKEKLRTLLQIALWQSTTAIPCYACKGAGEKPDNRGLKIISCRECNGTGKFRLWDLELAQSIGISKQAWSKGDWSNRYNEIQILIDRKEHGVIAKISEQLGSEISA